MLKHALKKTSLIWLYAHQSISIIKQIVSGSNNMESENLIVEARWRSIFSRCRKNSLLQLVSELVLALNEEGFHFTDLLIALSEYAKRESVVERESQPTWNIVASMLQEVAEVAETKGRELP